METIHEISSLAFLAIVRPQLSGISLPGSPGHLSCLRTGWPNVSKNSLTRHQLLRECLSKTSSVNNQHLHLPPCLSPPALHPVRLIRKVIPSHSHTDPAAVGSTVFRIAVVSRVIHAHLPPVSAPEPREAAAERRCHADARRVARHAAPAPVRVVDAYLSCRARLLLDAKPPAGLVGGRRLRRRVAGRACRDAR